MVCLNSSRQPGRLSSTQTETFHISGRQESLRDDEIEYRIHLLRLRADESQKAQLDPSYVPVPILEERLTHSFRVSSSTVVKYDLRGSADVYANTDPCHLDIPIFLTEVEFSCASSTFTEI